MKYDGMLGESAIQRWKFFGGLTSLGRCRGFGSFVQEVSGN